MPGDKPSTYGAQTNSQFMYLPPYGVGQPGSVTYGGGGGVPQPAFRDTYDAARSMYRRTPAAQYPDGYLGTITTRRTDKFMDALKSRVGERQYQRGVHKGERIDPGDYIWPAQFNPTQGLRAESAGRRQAPAGSYVDAAPINQFFNSQQDHTVKQLLDPHRREQLRRLRPPWQ